MCALLIIPDRGDKDYFLDLCERKGLGVEFNDFFLPKASGEHKKTLTEYLALPLPGIRTLHGAFFDVAVYSHDPELRRVSRERVRQSMALGARLSVGGVILHTGYNPLLKIPVYEDNFFARSMEFYRELLEEFPQVGLYLENVHEQTPAPLERFCAALGEYPNFGICLDMAHAHLTPTPEEEWLERLAPYVRHFHINDNLGDMDTHLPLGEGNMDYGRLLPLMERYCPKAHILLEVTGRTAIEKSLAYLDERKGGS